MIDLAITILCTGVGSGALFLSLACAHRIVSETRMKKSALERSLQAEEPQQAVDELQQRLEEFRRARFGPTMQQGSPHSQKIQKNR